MCLPLISSREWSNLYAEIARKTFGLMGISVEDAIPPASPRASEVSKESTPDKCCIPSCTCATVHTVLTAIYAARSLVTTDSETRDHRRYVVDANVGVYGGWKLGVYVGAYVGVPVGENVCECGGMFLAARRIRGSGGGNTGEYELKQRSG